MASCFRAAFSAALTGPQDYQARVEGRRSPPTLRLSDYGDTRDGVYRFSLTAATSQIAPRIGAGMSGDFRVVDGRIRVFEQTEEPPEQGGCAPCGS